MADAGTEEDLGTRGGRGFLLGGVGGGQGLQEATVGEDSFEARLVE